MATTQTAAATAISTGVPAAPPFTAPWAKFRNPPTDPAGYWNAVRYDPMVGGLVLQLGTQAHPATAPSTSGSMYIGYQWEGYLPGGLLEFTVRLHLGPVSILPNGGSTTPLLLAQLFGPQGQLADDALPPANRSDSWWVLRVKAPVPLQAGQYKFRFGAAIVSQYQGSQAPYCEVIVKDSSVTYSSGVEGTTAASLLSADLHDESAFFVEHVSEQDAARERLAALGA
ncbi:MAG TPA: hypothetical protein VIJ61_02780 [Thermoanaerobaculia bacterium]